MKRIIENNLSESIELLKGILDNQMAEIEKIADVFIACLKNGRKIILFGNGGSAADAQHLAAELVGRFEKNRKALAALSLSTNISNITALANDFGFETVFSRQIEALGIRGDVALGISTSGESKNVIEGILKAKKMGLTTVGFTGCSGGQLSKICDLSFIVNSKRTCRIQEMHITAGHIICSLAEDALSGEK